MSFILTEELKEKKYQDKVEVLRSLVDNNRHIIIHINTDEFKRIAMEEKELIFKVMLLDFKSDGKTFEFFKPITEDN